MPFISEKMAKNMDILPEGPVGFSKKKAWKNADNCEKHMPFIVTKMKRITKIWIYLQNYYRDS